jgi:methylmalonyl-CoA mutase C-terminal domain/subunit
MQLVRERQLDDVLVIVGGIIPDADIGDLKAAGIREVFPPGTRTAEIVEYVREHVREA